MQKSCKTCGEIKPLEDFSNNKNSKDGKRPQCRVCYNLYMKLWSRQNSETVNARVLSYHHANKEMKNLERAARSKANRLAGKERPKSKLSNAEVFEIKKKSLAKRMAAIASNGDKNISEKLLKSIRQKPCFYCGVAKAGSIDHVIPISRGGRNTEGNIVPACASCNSSKGFKTVTEWRIREKRITEVIVAKELL